MSAVGPKRSAPESELRTAPGDRPRPVDFVSDGQPPWSAEGATLFVFVGELFESGGTRRLAEFQQPAGLDLPDTLAGDAVLLGDLVERARRAVLEAEPEFDHLALAGGQALEHFADALAKQVRVHMFAGVRLLTATEEVFKSPFTVAADRFVQAHPGGGPDDAQAAGVFSPSRPAREPVPRRSARASVAADISPRIFSVFAIRPIWWHGTRTVRA